MNYKEAFEILEIDLIEIDYTDITLQLLKQKYHKLALQHHPDKNGNTISAKEKFQNINEAYSYLKREINILNPIKEEEDDDNTKSFFATEEFIYTTFLNLFLKDNKYNEMFCEIIKKIIINCKNISSQLFENIDKESLLEIYRFLSKYKSVFHLNESILNKMREIIVEKYKDITIYNLNPSITDLLDNNLYKLYINNKLYLVPLWHNELYFDNELIVLCEPELDKNITIDEYNNINIDIEICFKELQNILFNSVDKNITFFVGKKEFKIKLDLLHIKKQQYYKIKKEGLVKINDNDIFDISEKSDIIVSIHFY